jgi:alpha-tubulin suppressor-like RCC1 family protein
VTSVSVGDDLSCVVADGGLYCWGPGGIAGSTLPRAIEADGVFAGKSVTAVSTGSYSTCVIADATVYCTRNSWTFSPVGGPALGGKAVTAISAGGNMGTTACAVAEGRVYCWGAGRRGQLGDGKRAYSYEPVAVDVSGVLAGQDVQAIAVGMYHACALANGRTFCWGDDSMGQTGSGLQHAGRSYALVPAAVAGPLSTTGGPAVSVLAADATNSCAVASGVVYCWGWGLATLVRNGEAYQVSGFSGLTRIEDYCGIIRGRVNCWGKDKSSQRSAVPVAVPGLGHGRVTDLSAGWAHACAVVKGRAYCWGTGDLGRPSVKRSTTPVRVPLAAKRVTAISAGPAEWVYEDPQDEVDTFTGRTDTCAVADGRLFCWGWNTAGQLGIGHQRNTARPTPVTGGDLKGKVVAVSLSGDSTARTCAIAAGRVYCWGLGGLGVSGRRSSTLPIAVKRLPDDERVTDLAVGGNTCALVSGAVWCWGRSGQPLPRPVEVSGLTKPGQVVDISHSGNWGIWEPR